MKLQLHLLGDAAVNKNVRCENQSEKIEIILQLNAKGFSVCLCVPACTEKIGFLSYRKMLDGRVG